MAFEFKLPDIGEGLTEADIVRWVVPVGGAVEVDQVLVEVETAQGRRRDAVPGCRGRAPSWCR